MELNLPGTECTHPDAHLAFAGDSNGIGFWCPPCERWVTAALRQHPSWCLPKDHRALTGVDRATLPRVRFGEARTCAICLQTTEQAELHHWCPKALYQDNPPPNEGPQDWLCKSCHAAWHQIVTPMLVGGVTRERCLLFLRGLFKRFSPAEWRTFVDSVAYADSKAATTRRIPPRPPAPTEDAA